MKCQALFSLKNNQNVTCCSYNLIYCLIWPHWFLMRKCCRHGCSKHVKWARTYQFIYYASGKYTAPDESGIEINTCSFLIALQNFMLWVLIRSASERCFE